MTDTSESDRQNESAHTPTQAGDAVTSADNSMVPPPSFPSDSSGNRAVWVGSLLLMIVLVALLIAFIGALRHWFALHTGTLHGGPDVYYNFWSGF
ncbi:MAG: hypothetical protein ACRDYE_10475, partial [Acidimicrobiales bacterium]